MQAKNPWISDPEEREEKQDGKRTKHSVLVLYWRFTAAFIGRSLLHSINLEKFSEERKDRRGWIISFFLRAIIEKWNTGARKQILVQGIMMMPFGISYLLLLLSIVSLLLLLVSQRWLLLLLRLVVVALLEALLRVWRGDPVCDRDVLRRGRVGVGGVGRQGEVEVASVVAVLAVAGWNWRERNWTIDR